MLNWLSQEPTSGLDSSTAHSLMQTLKDYAVKEKKTIVATIHQPSSQMFYMFDKLLLLCCGRLAYFGGVTSVVPFFNSVGLEISAHYNPADFIMEKIKNKSHQENIINAAKALQISPDHCPDETEEALLHHSSYSHDHNRCSPAFTSVELLDNESNMKSMDIHVVIDDEKAMQRVYDKVANDDDSGRSSWSETDRCSTSNFSFNCSYTDEICINSHLHSSDQKWPTSFWTQLKVLTKRNFLEARNRMLSKLNWIQTIALAILAGLMWFQVARNEDTLNDIRGWMFFSKCPCLFLSNDSVLMTYRWSYNSYNLLDAVCTVRSSHIVSIWERSDKQRAVFGCISTIVILFGQNDWRTSVNDNSSVSILRHILPNAGLFQHIHIPFIMAFPHSLDHLCSECRPLYWRRMWWLGSVGHSLGVVLVVDHAFRGLLLGHNASLAVVVALLFHGLLCLPQHAKRRVLQRPTNRVSDDKVNKKLTIN